MKSYRLLSILMVILFLIPSSSFAQKEKAHEPEQVNWRIDNNGYWKKMAEKGFTTLNPMTNVPAAKYTGSKIDALSSITEDSPDVPVAPEGSTQSENSIFINPNDPQNILNSNNSVENPYPPLYGANDLYSFDGGTTWMGEINGAGVDNSGDPAVVIGNNGWWYVNSIINSSLGQQVAYSDDEGASWNVVTIDNNSGGYVLDKNHFWIDNTTTSPYDGHLYCAWTDFSGPFNNEIGLSYSGDQGLTWSATQEISSEVNAGSHCQGVNLNTGPNGEVYAVFAIYDGKADENAYGMAKSLDGGANWEPATRIIENVRGIRSSETSKYMRCNSFPVLAVDVSGGEYNGNLYMVWTNIGEPGLNQGPDIDVYMIRSANQGDTWSDPIKVNQDESNLGHEHYFPWITCDPVTGTLSVVFYDDRNVGGAQCEVFCANSFDAGDTWEDFKVSDVSFTPTPIPGLATGYMGDYLGISARDSYVYPCWTDNRTGDAMTYVSPYQTNNLSRPLNLTATLTEETGAVTLDWFYDVAPGFSYFIVYRDNIEIAQTTETTYDDQLPDYGIYQYKVSAYYEIDGESTPAAASLQWGNPHIFVTPDQLEQSLQPDQTATQYLSIENIGELDLHYDISTFILTDTKESKDYCPASGGCDEYIANVEFGDINNSSGCDEYHDYTALTTSINTGESIPITITNGVDIYYSDVCGIWVDWNQNEDFTDDEPITVSGGPAEFEANITPPDDAIGGTTRMRIRIQWDDVPEPCGTRQYGEVEDYSINVISWLAIAPKTGNVMPGETMEVAVNFDATDMALGDYQAEFSVGSDDPDLPTVVVPVTMHVIEMAVNATADPAEICYGEMVQLNAEGYGGTGSYTYSWTSDPEGFTSDIQNPEVMPMENTTYFVDMNDGVNTVSNQVTVTVHPLPSVYIGSDTSICQGEEITFDAGMGFAAYEWQDGSTGETFTATESGIYWVEVSTAYDCINRDSVVLTVIPLAGQAYQPAGPELVDLYEGYTSNYITAELPNVLDYTWNLDPVEAGSILNSGFDIAIEWNEDFTGQAELMVMASNECGDGPWSDSLEITVVNTTGINDIEQNLGLQVYPNPNDGVFTVEFNTKEEMYVNISLYNSLNAEVYRSENLHINGQHSEQLNLAHLAQGMYTLTIESKSGRASRQVIVKE